jgi:hypothetical protein
MTKRLVLTAVVLVLTACPIALCVRPCASITVDSYQQIQVGMTRQQVERILGGPPRNESAYPFETVQYSSVLHLDEWWGPDLVISVWLDAQGRVCDKNCKTHDFGPAEKPSLWQQVNSWLPWSRSAAPN